MRRKYTPVLDQIFDVINDYVSTLWLHVYLCGAPRTTLTDLVQRSGKFYKPWSTRESVVLVREKSLIAEYSEVTCLSQQAAYADVSFWDNEYIQYYIQA
jgi:hypothetical protein